ncbi:PREDICTED: putative ATP-dependent RNA helicase DHX57 [Nicrophorus vespilloides]|uniref:ATP-dependent RNA helicase DHX57 n=1 Tax=Nicrophorus vespilloides TaxID=110193 RepID=A0ABM1N3Z4_NICVS|nr:PREDICTED: putative ATP-dependent RNA helicase DHX57 [Nicrophorus vespilloides]
MASEQAINNADLFLREVADVKISNTPKHVAPKQVKEELQLLSLSKKSQEYIMDTLRHIHGEDFKLSDASSYEDKGNHVGKNFWKGRGNLIIKGCFDYSNTNNEPESELDRLKMFAQMRLESYGFHKEHCQEALDYCNGEVEESLCILYNKYLKIDAIAESEHNYSENELLEQRVDEKGVLESIYDNAFTEKVNNTVWIFNCKLDYLSKLYCNKPEKKKQVEKVQNKKKVEKCRYFQRGQPCKFGSKCRFSHEEDGPKNEVNQHLDNYTYELEIRFPHKTMYPFEAPIIFLKTDAVLPHLLNLHICKRLHQEAEVLASNGIASIYSIVELLQNEEEMTSYIKNNPIRFLDPDQSLFPKIQEIDPNKLKRSTHYKKGITNRDGKSKMSLEQIKKEDKKLAERFISIQNDNKYKKMQEVRNNLPAMSYKNTILNTMKTHQVLVVSGETGCGKSTQVPQYILDEWLENFKSDHVEIVCTQPRRISAIGVAERVAQERADKIGNVVGYQIRLESKVSSSTRLNFCTTGILLRRLEADPMLSNVTHIIVDEVHERSEESDFLLLILRDLLPLRPNLKIILMSATLNASIFSDYFGDVPVLEIPGRTFPVEQLFLEDIIETTGYVLDDVLTYGKKVKNMEQFEIEMQSCDVSMRNFMPKDCVKDENLRVAEVLARYNGYSMKTCKTLYLMDQMKINLELIENILCWIVKGKHEFPTTGCILVFLPGIAEIMALYDQLIVHPEFNPKNGKYVLLPLHSSLTSEEQSKVFENPKGARKIVLSTNIAETSVTIDDCIFVIDAGKMKEKRFDSNRNMESLETVWVTRANALQRKGRAGRVMSGVCIHLYTNHRFRYHMLPQPVPEIHRVPLEQLLLNIKVLPNFEDQDIYKVLNKIIEPPVKDSIDSSVKRLQNIGALDKEINLTPLGHHLAALPVDVRIGKLMLFGAMFSCVDSALTMAACLSYKSPFVTPFGKKDEANAKKRTFANGLSDQMTALKAYNKFQEVNKKSYYGGINYARENYLSHKTLITIADIKHQFLELLVSIDFVPINLNRRRRSGQDDVYQVTGQEFNANNDNQRVLSSILCAALYPNVAKILQPEKSFVVSAAGAVPKQHESKDFKFKTKQEQVFVHPSSIIYEIKQFASSFLCYQEKVKTNRIFVRDLCVIPLIPLVLFSGYELDINVHNGTTFIAMDDNWILFEVDEHKVAEMIKMIRIELLELLEEKIKDPLLNIQHHDKGERIINTILQLVSGE